MKLAKKIKLNHVYTIKDSLDHFIVVVVDIDKELDRVVTTILQDFTNTEENNTLWEFDFINSISSVPETDKNFNDSEHWAFYEIGHKDDSPEYFL